ncbi:MAG: NAD(P)H-dependent oxidoreductase [Pseudomonadota bacterium]
MKTLAFGASNSRNSINKALATYAASLLSEEVMTTDIEILDLNDYQAPIYSIDYEKEHGIPDAAKALKEKLQSAYQIIISFAEHNGSYTAAYKSIFDWMTRLEGSVYDGKSMVLLSTSPGVRGGASVLATAETSMPFFGATVKASLSIGKFYDVFDIEAGEVMDPVIKQKLLEALEGFKSE